MYILCTCIPIKTCEQLWYGLPCLKFISIPIWIVIHVDLRRFTLSWRFKFKMTHRWQNSPASHHYDAFVEMTCISSRLGFKLWIEDWWFKFFYHPKEFPSCYITSTGASYCWKTGGLQLMCNESANVHTRASLTAFYHRGNFDIRILLLPMELFLVCPGNWKCNLVCLYGKVCQ